MIDGDRLPTLTGNRVALRWLTPADAPALYALFGDPAVTRYWSSPPLADLEAARALVDEIHALFAADTLYQWGVVERGTDAAAEPPVIGTCTLASLDAANRRAEVGFALRRDRWGRGLMREALSLLIDHAFGPLALHRLEADVDPANAASVRLLERLGFAREGHLRERWFTHGTAQDSLDHGLLRREWPPRTA